MSIRQRIIAYLDYKGISKYKFYKDLELSNGFLDKTGAIGSDKCEIIINQYPDINLYWLITGEGPMLKPQGSTAPESKPIANDTEHNAHHIYKDKIEMLNRRIDDLLATIDTQKQLIDTLRQLLQLHKHDKPHPTTAPRTAE